MNRSARVIDLSDNARPRRPALTTLSQPDGEARSPFSQGQALC